MSLKTKFYQLFIKIYLKFYQYYILLHKLLFFHIIDDMVIINKVTNDQVKNVTIDYYLGRKIDESVFYVKIYNLKGTSHIAFDGNISHIKKLRNSSISETSLKRKNVILLDGDTPIDIDLAILDNYKINMDHIGESSITNMLAITQMLKIKCDNILIMEKFPFKKTILELKDASINDLYH